ncbi:MAG TPA: tRNA glutamyl-Q(34) synthetase GluQRS [Acidimicrobiaceae bacterium]|nr:tRNA glutamyl-Q(34) synthetase GluQRS [Acidimicrobiaceae bacterium]
MRNGRFAPSPTGDLHLGNLRTALVAWLWARAEGGAFWLRMENLDPITSRVEWERSQCADLQTFGIDWDGPVLRQTDRVEIYREAIADLSASGRTYWCYCTRREIAESAQAPHGIGGLYPQTCRHLTRAQRSAREAQGRPPALRLLVTEAEFSFDDAVVGTVSGPVDDVVLVRNDGVVSYNFASVFDDASTEVQCVVRGDDLLSSTPRQLAIAQACSFTPPGYAHIPLVLAPDGSRLAKRHGAVTLGQRFEAGQTPAMLCAQLARSAGLEVPEKEIVPRELVDRFTSETLSRSPWVVPEELLSSSPLAT